MITHSDTHSLSGFSGSRWTAAPCFHVAILISLGASIAFAQQDVETAIKQHFEKSTAELHRYGTRVTLFGECLCKTRPTDEVIEQEVALANQARTAGITRKPSRSLFALCHNLLIYQPDAGHELLNAVHQSEFDKEVRAYLSTAALATGEWGEQFAWKNLETPDVERRRFWSGHLARFAIYEQSIPTIRRVFEQEQDSTVRADLLRSLASIGTSRATEFIKQQIETAEDDEVQAAATFAFVELAGHGGIEYVEHIIPVGPISKKEKDEGLNWLKNYTTTESPFGTDLKNDLAFTRRFCDIKSPAMGWLNRRFETYQNPDGVPDTFDETDKKELLELLLDSKGFGLEAVKGTLFKCVAAKDVEPLLQIRAASWYSPNNYSQGRTKTIGILVRHIRKNPAR